METLRKKSFLFSGLEPCGRSLEMLTAISSHQEGNGLRMSLMQKKAVISNDNTEACRTSLS